MQTTTYSDPELGAMVAEHGAGWGPRVALFVVTALLAGVFAVAGFAGDEMLLGVISVVVGVALMVLTHVLLSKVRLRLFEHGVEHRGPFTTRRIAWNNLESYTLQIIDTNAAVAGGV